MATIPGQRGRLKLILGVAALIVAALAFWLFARDPIVSSSLTVRNRSDEALSDVVVAFANHGVRRAELPPGAAWTVRGNSTRAAGITGVEGMLLAFTYRGRRHRDEYDYLVGTMPAEHCDAEVAGDLARVRCCEARFRVTALACPGKWESRPPVPLSPRPSSAPR